MTFLVHGVIELDLILSSYSFFKGEIDYCCKIPQKLYNDNYYLEIDGEAWVVKNYSPHDISSRLQLSHQVNLLLQEQGRPVAFLERSNDGATLVKAGGRYFSLHRWVRGKHLSPFVDKINVTDDVVAEIAKALAMMHLITSTSSCVSKNEENTMHGAFLLQKPNLFYRTLMCRRGWHISLFNSLRLKRKKNKFDKWIIARLPSWIEVVNEFENIFSKNDLLDDDEIPIHNDINWENLIFDDNDKLLAIIDFDNLIYAPRLYEVGAAAIIIAGPNLNKINNFVREYTAVFGMACSSTLIWGCMVIKCLNSILFSITTYLDHTEEPSQVLQDWCIYLDECLHALLLSCHSSKLRF